MRDAGRIDDFAHFEAEADVEKTRRAALRQHAATFSLSPARRRLHID